MVFLQHLGVVLPVGYTVLGPILREVFWLIDFCFSSEVFRIFVVGFVVFVGIILK